MMPAEGASILELWVYQILWSVDPWLALGLGLVAILHGSLEEAISTSMEALALAPDSVDARVVLTAALVETGRLGSAEQAAKEIVGVEPRFTLARFAASRPYRDRAVLDRLLDSLGKAGLPRGDQPTSPEFAAPQAPGRRRVAPRPRR